MNAGLGGFYNAPVTKGLIFTSAGLSLLIGGLSNRKAEVGLSYEVFSHLSLWRLVTSNLVFVNPGEGLFGYMLLYYFRLFERQRGSSKYGAFLFLSALVSTILELFCILCTPAASKGLSSGPFPIIFACFVQFLYDVPSSSHFSIFVIPFSDKSFVGLVALQLLASSYGASAVPALCGVVAGFLYRSNLWGLRSFRLPRAVEGALRSTIGALVASASPSSPPPRPPRAGLAGPAQGAGRGGAGGTLRQRDLREFAADGAWAGAAPTAFPAAGMEGFRGGQGRFGGAGGAAFMGGSGGGGMWMGMGQGMHAGGLAPPTPPEEAVEALVAMGFDRERAIRALIRGHNDLNVATNLLLGGGPV